MTTSPSAAAFYPIGTPGQPWGDAERAQWLAQQRVQRRYADDVLPVIERLRGQFERQARFIADASHELRTPLAALKARIELGLREAEPAVWRSTLEDAGQSTDKVIHLANQLLSLARIESGAQSIAEGGAQRLDLSQLARELGLAMAALRFPASISRRPAASLASLGAPCAGRARRRMASILASSTRGSTGFTT